MILELDIADERNYPDLLDDLMIIYHVVADNNMLSNVVFTTKQDRLRDMIENGCINMNVSVAWIVSLDLANTALDIKDKVKNINYSIWLPYLTSEIVELAHSNGIKIKTWPAANQEEIDLAFDMGADYIITDFY